MDLVKKVLAVSTLTLLLSFRLSACCTLSKVALHRATIADRPTLLLLMAANTETNKNVARTHVVGVSGKEGTGEETGAHHTYGIFYSYRHLVSALVPNEHQNSGVRKDWRILPGGTSCRTSIGTPPQHRVKN